MKPKRIPLAELEKYVHMDVTIKSDCERGRYELRSREEYEKARREEKAEIVMIFPIDQSYFDVNGDYIKKFRLIWDGRAPNMYWTYSERIRMLK